ncbi:TPA: sigma-E factor regulatory protein RseB [Pasteurella multocida]|nr:sigma-E factor regulatory protein RseB [Pasteurella multocida]HDR1432923.1 sigma-E factor regulatory protein RseB [Pasteurella multocida]HDR1790146.1 sigma-E factor regulatory protein RseB [Pasteurella multocida]HDR1828466.1 sigma-E factor regulatory protein RseB [Pasteurella multocida]
MVATMFKALQQSLTFFLLALCSFNTLAEESLSAKQILLKMPEAREKLSYEIAFVKTTPANMDSLRYRHLHIDGKSYAQLVTLDGVQQEIVLRDNLVSYFQPNFQPFTIHSAQIIDSLPALMNANFERLEKYYDFVKMGRNRVANRLVQTIRILPKDDFRYQYVAFIDEENHLLLQSDILDRDGNLLDQFRVVNLYIGDGLQGLAEYLENIVFPPLLIDKKEETTPTFHWQTSWLPQGFVKINQAVGLDDERHIESQLYSDGLFSFTLYVSDPIAEVNLDNTWKQGTYTIYSEMINGKEITFVGQLPISTAKRIVQDIQFKK